MKKQLAALAVAAFAACSSFAATSGVVITEWMYQGAGSTDREFIEFTNLGPTAVDFSGWSYDDDSRSAGTFPLSAFGIVAPGESVIITEMNAAAFRDAWGLDASVKVWGPYTNNLGNGDEINLFDGAGGLVDRLTYGSDPRTRGVSGRATSASALVALTRQANTPSPSNAHHSHRPAREAGRVCSNRPRPATAVGSGARPMNSACTMGRASAGASNGHDRDAMSSNKVPARERRARPAVPFSISQPSAASTYSPASACAPQLMGTYSRHTKPQATSALTAAISAMPGRAACSCPCHNASARASTSTLASSPSGHQAALCSSNRRQ